jgi:hypothetical protein
LRFGQLGRFSTLHARTCEASDYHQPWALGPGFSGFTLHLHTPGATGGRQGRYRQGLRAWWNARFITYSKPLAAMPGKVISCFPGNVIRGHGWQDGRGRSDGGLPGGGHRGLPSGAGVRDGGGLGSARKKYCGMVRNGAESGPESGVQLRQVASAHPKFKARSPRSAVHSSGGRGLTSGKSMPDRAAGGGGAHDATRVAVKMVMKGCAGVVAASGPDFGRGARSRSGRRRSF